MRKTIKLEKLMDEIRTNVDYATMYINRDNKELACHHATVAYYLFRTACYMLIDGKDNFSEAYDEIVTLSRMNEIYKSQFLGHYVNELMNK